MFDGNFLLKILITFFWEIRFYSSKLSQNFAFLIHFAENRDLKTTDTVSENFKRELVEIRRAEIKVLPFLISD